MFRSRAETRSAPRRAGAVLAALALLNVLVAPAAFACDGAGGQAQVEVIAPHGHMTGHDGASGHQAAPSRHAASGTHVPADSPACSTQSDACASNCAQMAGCTAHLFLAAPGAGLIPVVATGGLMVPTQHQVDRSIAPDFPPPRA